MLDTRLYPFETVSRDKSIYIDNSMPRTLPDSKILVLKVIKRFQTEAQRNKPIAGFSNPLKRAALTLGLSRKCIDRITKGDSAGLTCSTNTAKSMTERKQAVCS